MQPDIWDAINDHYEAPFHEGVLHNATHRFLAENRSCGDSVQIQIRVDNGYIMEAWFTGDGCVMSQASASMLVRSIEGKTLEQVRQLTSVEWMNKFKGVFTPKKRQCAILAWQALQGCIKG